MGRRRATQAQQVEHDNERAALLASRRRSEGKHIAIDGKASRGSTDSRTDNKALHTVSAYLSEPGLVPGQVKTTETSNEVGAMPELLQLLNLRGATVTRHRPKNAAANMTILHHFALNLVSPAHSGPR
ncbi:MAG: ISAs1 family transposase [Deltaproteobacteria bacterium]|nr:ISAs1 family transposase [Deltaproteobacteria bacterium]